jgi:hypothetical protein
MAKHLGLTGSALFVSLAVWWGVRPPGDGRTVRDDRADSSAAQRDSIPLTIRSPRPACPADSASGTTGVREAIDDPTTGSAASAPRGANEPELPRKVFSPYDGSRGVAGKKINVRAGDNLQRAIDRAGRGDEIVVEAGARFLGNFVLRRKPGEGWITIRSDVPLAPSGNRMTPTAARKLAKIVTANSEPALRVEDGASGWRLVGLEVGAAPGVAVAYTLVSFGDGDEGSLAQVPRRLVLDRSYVHGSDQLDVRRGVGLQCAECAVVDSWISEIHSAFDAAAVWGWNGPGPMLIENNRLEASGENVMFGGADPRIPGVQPADITIRHNHLIKPLAWKGRWLAKTLVEFKSAVRVLMEGNELENSWPEGQAGFAAVWWSTDQYGSAPWVMTCDITFRNNRVDNVAGGILLAAYSDRAANPAMTRVAIRDNLFTNVGAGGVNGRLFWLVGPLTNLLITHNTAFAPVSSVFFDGTISSVPGLVLNDNILGDGEYNVFSTNGQGLAAILATVGTEDAMRGNVFVRPSWVNYGSANFTAATPGAVGFNSWPQDPRLSGSSPFRGRATDGRDPGVDADALASATRGAK